jgi:hypothetical protein
MIKRFATTGLLATWLLAALMPVAPAQLGPLWTSRIQLPSAPGNTCASNCVTASASQSFFDSLAIGAQPNFPGTPADSPNFITQVEALGIKHVRLGATGGPSNMNGTYQPPWTTYNTLASAGFTNDFVWSSGDWGFNDPSTWAETPLAFHQGVNGVATYEGTNEPNQSCGHPSTWATQEQGYATRLYSYMHANGLNFPLLAPSMGNCAGLATMLTESQALGNLQGTGADYGNMHSYAGPTWPENGCLVNSQCSSTGFANSYLNASKVIIPTGPQEVTETGWGTDQIGNTAQMEYAIRTFLNDWNKGVLRTYFFVLYDDPALGSAQFYGIIASGYAPKPSYYAIQSLANAVSDPGSAISPGQLGFTLTGSTSNLNSLLLQKRDGTFRLFLWVAEAQGSASQTVNLNLFRSSRRFRD